MNAPHEPRLARVAAMIADPARSRMLAYLMSGDRASAGELARAASVAASTASGHLAKLEAAGLVRVDARGRHRYYRLADDEIAHALEAHALVAERDAHDRAWSSPQRERLRDARCCYRHLAGRLGVRLFDALAREDRMRARGADYELTPAGEAWVASIGFAPPARKPGRRWAYACLDWSERREHLGGALATALLEHFVERDWLRRPDPRDRALVLTEAGRVALLPWLDGPTAARDRADVPLSMVGR